MTTQVIGKAQVGVVEKVRRLVDRVATHLREMGEIAHWARVTAEQREANLGFRVGLGLDSDK